MSESFSGRRGLDDRGENTPSGDSVQDHHGPVLMEGPTKRQGDGWKGMKPWNERFIVLRALALICYQKGAVGPPETVWKIDKVAQIQLKPLRYMWCACCCDALHLHYTDIYIPLTGLGVQMAFAASDKKATGCCIEMNSLDTDGTFGPSAHWLFEDRYERDRYRRRPACTAEVVATCACNVKYDRATLHRAVGKKCCCCLTVCVVSLAVTAG